MSRIGMHRQDKAMCCRMLYSRAFSVAEASDCSTLRLKAERCRC